MRRLARTAFTTFSLATFLSLVSAHSYAVQPAIQILGVMKQKDQWQVGTVDNQGDKYCAMVGNFDQASVLAFARNPEGFGSLAIEFRDDMFQKGKDYEVQLAVDTGIPMTFTGKASNTRSLVIQIGQDSAVYNALSSSKTLRFTSSAIDAKFALAKFSNNYKKLVSCATALMPIDPNVPQMAAVKVGDVEAVEMTDQKLAKAIETETAGAEVVTVPLKNPEAKAAEMQAAQTPETAPAEEKKSFFGKFFGKLKGSDEASAERTATETETAEAEVVEKTEADAKKKEAVVAKAEATPVVKAAEKKPEAVVTAEKAEAKTEEVAKVAEEVSATEKPVARKLLAAMKGGVSNAPALPEKIGLSAREMEAQQTAALQKAIHAKENEIAVLAAVRAQAARDEMAVAELQHKIYSRKAGELKLEKEALEAAPAEASLDNATAAASKATVAEEKRIAALKQKNVELAQIEQEKASSDKALTQKLSKMQKEFEQEKLALEAERDGLKKQLAEAVALNKTTLPQKTAELTAGQNRIAQLEEKLGGAEAARLKLAENLTAMEGENQKLEAALAEKEKALADTTADAAALAKLQADMQSLQKELAEKSMQSAALEESLTAEKAKASAALTAALGEKDTALETLETRLSEAETARKAEMERAAKLEAARLEAEKKIAALEATLAETAAKAEADAKLKAELAEKEKLAALAKQADEEKKKLAAANEKSLMQAETEIALLKEEKERLQAQLSRKTDVKAVAAIAPAVPVVAEPKKLPAAKPVASAKPVIEERIPGTDVAMVMSQLEPAAGTVEVEVFEAPIVSSVPVRPALQQPQPQAMAATPNRAESFLNGIMKHHVPDSTAAAIKKPQVPVAAQPQNTMPVMEPVTTQPVPAAPTTTLAPKKPMLMPVAAAVPTQGGMKPLSLEALLTQAGLRGAVFAPATTAGIREWTLGGVNGMYEEMPKTASFDAQIGQYIGRYEQDCPGKLSVQMGRPQQTAAGMLASGSMHCGMPDNSYSTSMIFVDGGAQFGALLHSGQGDDLAQVKSLGDNLYYALSASGGIAAMPSMLPQKSAGMMPMQTGQDDFLPPVTEQPAMRFNLRSTAEPAQEFETVVIQ